MSEVDRLSNSGLYPALPIADKRSRKDKEGSAGQPAADKRSPEPKSGEAQQSNQPRPPKSLIDEYA
ncbi:MAG TPA: hypothetical protein VME42_15350 [Steroidobacteraceae bacterium]|nr:hypothetical protein [Steroidobacteraceae bacterium]